MNVLKYYLESLNQTDLDNKLSGYDVIIYKTDDDLKKGLLRYNKAPIEKCFLFILPNEQIGDFHTIGMKFPIDIYFYNKDKQLDSSKLNSEPGIRSIKSKGEVKYIVEIPR